MGGLDFLGQFSGCWWDYGKVKGNGMNLNFVVQQIWLGRPQALAWQRPQEWTAPPPPPSRAIVKDVVILGSHMYNLIFYIFLNHSLCTRHCESDTDLHKTYSLSWRNLHTSWGGIKCKKLTITQNVKVPGYLQSIAKCCLPILATLPWLHIHFNLPQISFWNAMHSLVYVLGICFLHSVPYTQSQVTV